MYAKVFRQIYDSSIAEDYEVRHVFMDMLVLADSDGVVDMTPEALARITNVPIDIVNNAIRVLETPDPRSRTPDYEGCRIKRLDDHRDWGWLILNYARFRGTATEQKRRELTKLRVRKLREKRKLESEPCNDSNALPMRTSPSPSYSVPEGGTGGNTVLPHSFPNTPEEAVTHASFVGVDPEFATHAWNKAMARGGCDARGLPIKSFRHYLATEWAYERERRSKGAAPQTNGSVPAWKKMQLLEEAIASHSANRECAGYNQQCTELEKNDLRMKREQLRKLKAEAINNR